MKPARLYEIFTEALENESIREEIISLISAKIAEDRLDGQTELFPSTDTAALSAENTALSRKIALLELEISRLENENASCTSRIRQCNETLNTYITAYGSQIALYEKYKTLSEKSMKVMSGIFKNNTLSGIFLCGVQPDNLKSLRDYTESLAINSYDESRSDISVLNDLYTYMLSCYNSTFSSPVYRLFGAAPGDEFDSERHCNTGTARSGKISKLLLQGCEYAANGKLVRKAIVIV